MNSNNRTEKIVELIWLTSGFGMTQLMKKEDFSKLNLETVSKISTEMTLFILHVCDRKIFSLVGSEDRKEIVSNVLDSVYQKLEKHDEKALKKLYGERTDKNQNEYFNTSVR